MGDPRSSSIRRMEWPPRVAHEDGLLQQRIAGRCAPQRRANEGRAKVPVRHDRPPGPHPGLHAIGNSWHALPARTAMTALQTHPREERPHVVRNP